MRDRPSFGTDAGPADQPKACAARNGAAGQYLRAQGSGLLIAGQSGRALELGQQFEEQQNASECRFSGQELLQTETIGCQIILYFFNAVFNVGPLVAFPPELQLRGSATGDEDAECIAGHVDQLSTDALRFSRTVFANDNKTSGCFPVVQTQLKLAACMVPARSSLRRHSGCSCSERVRVFGPYGIADQKEDLRPSWISRGVRMVLVMRP
jgi:hypothetical protein